MSSDMGSFPDPKTSVFMSHLNDKRQEDAMAQKTGTGRLCCGVDAIYEQSSDDVLE